MSIVLNGRYIQRTSDLINRASNSYTLMAWVRFSTVSAWQGVFSLYQSNNRWDALGLYSGNQWYYGRDDNTASGATPSSNVWYHAALVGTTGTISAYINGAIIGSGLTQNTGSINETNLILGRWSTSSDDFLGDMAAVKIWRGLNMSAAQIQQEMWTYLPQRTESLYAFLPCITAPGTTDESGNARNFTASSAPTLSAISGPPIGWAALAPIVILPPPTQGGGGEQYDQSVTGAITPAAAMLRQTAALRVGATAPSGALIRALLMAKTGSIEPAGAQTRQTTRPLSGATTPAGALESLRLIVRTLTGAIAPVGGLVRQSAHALAGALAPAGNALRQTARTLTGATAPSGALTSIKTFLVEVAGALTPAGSIARQTARALAGALTPAGAALKSTARALSGAVAPSGALASIKTFIAYVTGAITPTGALGKLPRKALAGVTAPAATLARQTQRALIGAFDPDGALSGLRLVFVTVSGALDPAGTIRRDIIRALNSAITPAAVLTKGIARSLSGALSALGALARSVLGLNPLAQAAASDTAAFRAVASDSGVYAVTASNAAAFRATVTDAIVG